jgi:hypothetical protein
MTMLKTATLTMTFTPARREARPMCGSRRRTGRPARVSGRKWFACRAA